MSNRQIPPEIAAHLGPTREPRGFVEKVIEQCHLAKLQDEFQDFAPLAAAMELVMDEFESKSFAKPNVRKAWCRVVQYLQDDDDILEHNRFIPCRRSSQEFDPVVDNKLLEVFLIWYESRSSSDLVKIHLCPNCGGKVDALRSRERNEVESESDFESDDEWADWMAEEYGM